MFRVVLAFSGGLDTSFCVVYLREEKGAAVTTVTVNTGGATPADLAEIERRALALGAVEHREIDARETVFSRHIAHLIRGNVLRGEVYPLSVAAERAEQALQVARVAREIDADAVAHGSTGAGNDQIRFDIAFHTLLPGVSIITPIRDLGLTRESATAYLVERGLPVPSGAQRYSVNRGMWGTTLGGGWTHDPWNAPPADAWPPCTGRPEGEDLVIEWADGLPCALDGQKLGGHALVEVLSERLAPYGIGRAIHLGETVLGIKGRIGFEAGSALLLIQAHRELEKLVLTRWQMFWKDHLARFYGDRLHEGQHFDPVMRDIEAFIGHSQRVVSGETRVHVQPEHFQVTGVRSPHTLMDPGVARYGETHFLWTGDEARAFAKVAAIPGLLAARRPGEGDPWS